MDIFHTLFKKRKELDMSTTPVVPAPPVPSSTGSISANIVKGVAAVEENAQKFTPLAIQAALQVESTLASAPSMTKLATGIGIVLDLAHAGETIPIPSVQAISSLVDLFAQVVAGFNATGLFKRFKHSSPAPVTVVAQPVPTS